MVVDEAHELARHLAGEHHAHHVHRLGRRDPQAALELGLDAQPAQHVGDLRAAAVHHDGLEAQQAQVHDVLGEGALQDVVHHGVAAVLDDDDGALELLDPRHRVDEDADLLLRVEVGGIDQFAHELYALFSWT